MVDVHHVDAWRRGVSAQRGLRGRARRRRGIRQEPIIRPCAGAHHHIRLLCRLPVWRASKVQRPYFPHHNRAASEKLTHKRDSLELSPTMALGDSKSAVLFWLVISTCAKCFANAYASSWAPAAAGAWPRPLFPAHLRRPCAAAPQTVVCSGQWEEIGGGKAVCKRVLEKGWGKMPQQGVDVEVEYVGTLGERDWSVGDVLECWLQVPPARMMPPGCANQKSRSSSSHTLMGV